MGTLLGALWADYAQQFISGRRFPSIANSETVAAFVLGSEQHIPNERMTSARLHQHTRLLLLRIWFLSFPVRLTPTCPLVMCATRHAAPCRLRAASCTRCFSHASRSTRAHWAL
jgi:hypothetical protein